ncbi:MAG: hypothetical protein JSW11_18005 [Candidatus Heimdallarchaeota archaeon]|nr:MAG: hypothetical protein JSW11_18005 [Candidatus Heimdallarchaeota archaeon]
MVRRNVYLSICAVGFVFAVLTLITEQQTEVALTILYITSVIVLSIKFIEEWQYFQRFNAPIASAVFILIPSLIALGGTFLAQYASLGEDGILQAYILEMTLDINFLNIDRFFLFLNLFSVVFVLPPFIFLLLLIRRYYSGLYPLIFISRKKYQNELIILYNVGMFLSLSFYWIQTGSIELSGLGFISISSILFVQHYVLKVILVPIRRIPIRGATQRSLPRQLNRTRAPQTSSQSSRQPQSSFNSLPTAVRPSSREILNRERASSQSTMNIVPGIDTGVNITRIEKIPPAILSKLIPIGQHLTDDDFRCIFCYEFPTEANKRVVICPHCGHPAHSHELEKWLSVANICSRCNKEISTEKMYRLSGKSYQKLIKMYQNNHLNSRWR